nr:pre-mRNA-splicing factor cwc25-like [Hydra vulgaris]
MTHRDKHNKDSSRHNSEIENKRTKEYDQKVEEVNKKEDRSRNSSKRRHHEDDYHENKKSKNDSSRDREVATELLYQRRKGEDRDYIDKYKKNKDLESPRRRRSSDKHLTRSR